MRGIGKRLKEAGERKLVENHGKLSVSDRSSIPIPKVVLFREGFSPKVLA